MIDIVEEVSSRYGQKALRKSAMNIRGGAGVFKKVMQGKGYRTAIEIGTYKGISAAEMSKYCDKVITFDLADGKLEKNGETFNRHELWKSLGIKNIEFIAVKDDAEKKRIIDGLEFDFAFIDGAHDETVANDFDLVKRCGNVLFHDADDNGPGKSNCVFEFISTLPKDQVEFVDIFAMWHDKKVK